MKFRGQPQAGRNANRRGDGQPGANGPAQGRQMGPWQRRMFAMGDDGRAALLIRDDGMVVVELLGEDGQTARAIDVKRMEIWITGMGEEVVSGSLLAEAAADGGTGASRFHSKAGLVQLGNDLQINVVHKASETATAYKFRVPADYGKPGQ